MNTWRCVSNLTTTSVTCTISKLACHITIHERMHLAPGQVPLLVQWTCLKLLDLLTHMHIHIHLHKNIVFDHPFPKKKTTGGGKLILCLYCGLAGHWATDCPFKKDPRLNSTSISGRFLLLLYHLFLHLLLQHLLLLYTPILYSNPGAAFFHERKNSASL